jgi:drug/metabolite transporter (DMT)-like permease
LRDAVFRKMITRVSVVGAASSLMFYCLTYIPVSTVVTLFNMGPIFIFFVEAIAYKVPLRLRSVFPTPPVCS